MADREDDELERMRDRRRGWHRSVAVTVVSAMIGTALTVPVALLITRTEDDPPSTGGTLLPVVDGVDGVSFAPPAGWQVNLDPLPRADPPILFSAGDFDVSTSRSCLGYPGLAGAHRAASLVWVTEPGRATGHRPPAFAFPPRPPSLESSLLEGGFRDVFVHESCLQLRPIRHLRFWDAGRLLDAFVVIPTLREADRGGAVALLDSLRFRPTEDAVCPQTGPRSHPACPEAQWIQLLARDRSLRVVGVAGDALILRGTGRRFTVRTVAGGLDSATIPGRFDRVPNSAHMAIHADRNRAVWEVAGRTIWMETGPGETRLPRIDLVAEVALASRELPFPPPILGGR